MVDRLAHAPTVSLAASKQAIRGAWCATLDEQLEVERALQRKCGLSEDYKEGVSMRSRRAAPRISPAAEAKPCSELALPNYWLSRFPSFREECSWVGRAELAAAVVQCRCARRC